METIFKNYTFIVALLLVIPLTSCSSDDNNTPEPTIAELLANKWFVVEEEDRTTDPPTINEFNDCEKNGYFNFISDGTFVAESFSQNLDGDCESFGVLAAKYVFSADGKKVIISDTMNTLSIVYVIESISNRTLTLFAEGFPALKSKFER